jgi:hypothetical protein
MSHTAIWVIGLIILFVLGSLLGLRISPREKALGQLRERARKMGLHPRLVPAPHWTGHLATNGQLGGMVAYYHLVVPQGQLPLVQAKIVDQRLQVVHGSSIVQGEMFDIVGAQAIDMQANSIGVYWDEEADLHGSSLEHMKTALTSLTQRASA